MSHEIDLDSTLGRAASHIAGEGIDPSEMVLLVHPDRPFQFNRAVARATCVVYGQDYVRILSDDESGIVLHSPNMGTIAHLLLALRVGDTLLGRVASTLSDVYAEDFSAGSALSGRLGLSRLRGKYGSDNAVARFISCAEERIYQDLLDLSGKEPESDENIDFPPLSYEGFVAVLAGVIRSIDGLNQNVQGAVG